MARGVLSGFLAGTAVSTAAVAVVSVLASPPRQPDIAATAPAQTRTPAVPDATPGAMPRREDGDPLQTATPAVPEPDTGPSGRLVFETANAPKPSAPVTAPEALPEPVSPISEGRVEIASSEPVYPNPRARAPEAPSADTRSQIVVDTQPAAPLPERAPEGIQQQLAEAAAPRFVEELVVVTPDPSVTEVVIAATPSVPAAPLRPQDPALPTVSVTPADPAPADPDPADPAPADPIAAGPEPVDPPADVVADASGQVEPPITSDTAEEADAGTETAQVGSAAQTASDGSSPAEPELTQTPDAQSDTQEATETAQAVTENAGATETATADASPSVADNAGAAETAEAAPTIVDDTDAAETEIADISPETPVEATPSEPDTSDAMAVAILAPNSTGRVTIGTPAKSLLDRGTGALSDRLPRLREVADTETEIATAPATDTLGDTAEAEGAPALKRFAQDYDASSERPMLSIVLIDSGTALGEDNIGIEALGSFPYSLTVAIDASLPDAADRAAMYRAQGMEVMAMVDLPPSLTASDTEVALAAALDAVPESVAVLEGPQNGLQGSKDISDQVSEILKDTGHGIIWQPNGLDTAQKLASRAGIPSQTLFRDFDAKDQKPVVIRRFLDQAAFTAGQRGSVVMVGRLRPETISALLVWGLQDRASRVAVAPVSAVLSAKEEGGS